MVSAIISVLIGVASFVAPIPVVAPVLGLALGANGYIRQSKLPAEDQRKSVKVACVVGALMCSVAVAAAFVGRFG